MRSSHSSNSSAALPLFTLRALNNQYQFSSVQFSCSVVSDSLRPHESQHTRPPFPSKTPGAHWDSRPSSQWCHPAVSSSVVPLPSCPQSLPASESFPMSQLFAWGGQSTGVSALASFLPKIPGLISFRMDWLDLLAISIQFDKNTLLPLCTSKSYKLLQLQCNLMEWNKSVYPCCVLFRLHGIHIQYVSSVYSLLFLLKLTLIFRQFSVAVKLIFHR